jgi:hypothetical protein
MPVCVSPATARQALNGKYKSRVRLTRELKISRDTITAIKGLIVGIQKQKLRYEDVVEDIKLVLENDEILMNGVKL